MKRIAVIIMLIVSLGSLYAGDYYDISLSIGHGIYRWPEKGISFSYGMNVGLSERWEMEVWGVSELLPMPFANNMFGIDFSAAILGPRSTASKVAGSGINTLIGIGGFYRTDNNGAGPMVSITPLTVGSPISGRRERIQVLTEELIYEVLSAIGEIPPGFVSTYGDIARILGMERRSRLIGRICSLSEYYGEYPCHRIVNHAGRLVPGWKEQHGLLEDEGVPFADYNHVDLTKCRWNWK